MIPHPHRTKGAGPQLGARHPGEPGPFGVRPDPDEDDDITEEEGHPTWELR